MSLEERIIYLESELKKANEERIKYKTLFEASGDALSIIDLSTGKFVECNEAAVALHGVGSKQNFLNLTPGSISPEFQPCGKRSEELAFEHIQKTHSLGPQLFQWTHSKLDGTTFPCLVSLTAASISGKSLVLAIGRDISELVKSQTQLEQALSDKVNYQSAYREEKEKFESFVNLAPVGIAINKMKDGSFEYVNEEFSRFTGYEVDELNHMDYWQLTPKKYEQQEAQQLASLNETGRYGPYYKEYTHKRGHNYPVLLSGIKTTKADGEEYIWSVVQDVTAQKRIEAQVELEKTKAESTALRMKLANDSAGIGVWEWDITSNTLIWDDWMYRLFGVSLSDFSSASEAWENCVHPDDLIKTQKLMASTLRDETEYRPSFRVTHPNGDVRILKATAELLRNKNGEVVKVIGVNFDITENVNAINSMTQAKQVAEEAVKAKSDFLANMSHEIRTPMNAILGGLQLLQDADLTPELRKIHTNASFSAQSLLTIINDILDYSKIESNNLQLENAQFSMSEVLKSVEYDLDSQVSLKRIGFTINKDKSFIEYWLGDLVRVKQIILNLASNAVKFTHQGNVQINVGCKLRHDKKSIVIEIIDSGIGMSEEAIKRIFDRFSQADASTTRKYGGTGLGMAITTSLVKMMDGTIDVLSREGEGTTVTVILPIDEVDFTVKEVHKKSLSAPDLSKKKILIAEDNAINKVLIESMLRATNAELTIVENGQLAVEATEENEFDLVFMDIHMPVMDGIEAQRLIKLTRPTLPVIALTANVMTEDVERYLAQGFIAHVAKPIDMNNLYGKLKNLLETRN